MITLGEQATPLTQQWNYETAEEFPSRALLPWNFPREAFPRQAFPRQAFARQAFLAKRFSWGIRRLSRGILCISKEITAKSNPTQLSKIWIIGCYKNLYFGLFGLHFLLRLNYTFVDNIHGMALLRYVW